MKRSRVRTMIRGRAIRWRLPLALLPAGVIATPAVAQRDSVTVRTVSSWQKDVDRLKQELLSQRKLELEFARTLGTLQARLRTVPPDSERTGLQAQSQLLFGKLRETARQQFVLRRDIESLCSAVTKPEGWLGVATTGFSVIDRQGDGPQVVRFMEKPIVESVDPGSPADRVGLRAGDVLLEIGGKQLLHNDVVFAELLRPGERIAVKVQRGREVLTVSPVVEPVPQGLSMTPCSWVDAGTAYVLAPMPSGQAFQFEVESGRDVTRPRFVFATPRSRRDSSGATAPMPVPPVFAGPMTQFYSGGISSLAGIELVVLNPESSRALGVAHGLFVNQVAPGTPGREAGLQGGDVLLSADSVDLRSVGALQRVIRASRDRTVTIMIMRERKQETVTLRW